MIIWRSALEEGVKNMVWLAGSATWLVEVIAYILLALMAAVAGILIVTLWERTNSLRKEVERLQRDSQDNGRDK